MKLGKLVTGLIGIFYRRVFSREMSAAEGDFVQSLSWVGAGTFVATALVAVFSILGGRLLGPAEYGRFTLIQSVAMFLCIPMTMGFNVSMLKYNAEKAEDTRQRTIISTAYIIIAGLTAVSVALMLLLARSLSGWFAATPELFRMSICFAFLYTVFTLAQTTLRSVNRMRAFAVSQPVHALILLIAFAVFVLRDRLTFEAMVYSMLFTFAATSLLIHFRYTRRYITFHVDKRWAGTLSRFSAATITALIAAALYTEIGKIIVAHYLTVADVGIYGAYFTATMAVASTLWGIFNMVFFPTASKYRDKRPLLRRINRLVPFIIMLGIPLIMGSGYVILLLYGGDYPFNLSWLALFASAAVLSVIRGLYTALLTSEGPGGAAHSSAAAVVTAVVMVALGLLLVPLIGIAGAMVAANAAFVVGIGLLLWRGRRYLQGT